MFNMIVYMTNHSVAFTSSTMDGRLWYKVRIFVPRFVGPVRDTDFGPDSNLTRYDFPVFSVRSVVKDFRNRTDSEFGPDFRNI